MLHSFVEKKIEEVYILRKLHVWTSIWPLVYFICDSVLWLKTIIKWNAVHTSTQYTLMCLQSAFTPHNIPSDEPIGLIKTCLLLFKGQKSVQVVSDDGFGKSVTVKGQTRGSSGSACSGQPTAKDHGSKQMSQKSAQCYCFMSLVFFLLV